MPDPILAAKSIVDQDWNFSKRKLGNANSQLDQILIFKKDEDEIARAMDEVKSHLFHTRKGIKRLYQTGFAFCGDARKKLGSPYAKLRKNITEIIDGLKSISISESLRLGSLERELEEVKLSIQKLEVNISELLRVISQSIARIREKIQQFQFKQSHFLSTMPMRDEYLVPLFFLISKTMKSLEIMTPHIDEVHLRFLSQLKECHAQPGFSLKMVLRVERTAKNFLEDLDLPWFQARINYRIHGRLIVSDKKIAIVSSADQQSITYSGHFESGILTDKTELVSSCHTFFEEAWDHGSDLAVCDHPLKDSKVILKSETRNREGIFVELYWALQDVDPTHFLRMVTESWGYIDSRRKSSELVQQLRDFPEFRHISFFSPILEVLQLENGDPTEISKCVFEVLKQVLEPNSSVDVKFYDLEKGKIITDKISEKTADKLTKDHQCSISDESSNRVLVFSHKRKFVVTFTKWKMSPL